MGHQRLPGVWQRLLEAERNLLGLRIDVHHRHVHFLAHLEHFVGMPHPRPGQLGHMDQAIGAAQVHKGPKRRQAGHAPVPHLPGPQFR